MGDLITQVVGQLLDILPTGLYAPDIVLRDNEESDLFRATIYHELAHASHYKLAGECYWQKVRAHEFFWGIQTGDPYGDPTDIPFPEPYYSNFPIVAMAESWGEHIGVLYASRKYPSTQISGQPFIWLEYLEAVLTVKNNFIPEGIHWDLMDGINSSDGTLPNGVVINDAVAEATLIELYNLLDNETVVGFRADVISSTSATGSILPLFTQYGY